MKLSEIRKKLDNKHTILEHLYEYVQPAGNALCLFYEMIEDDNVNDRSAKEAKNTLVSIFGREHFNAINLLSPFIEWEVQKTIHEKIVSYWQAKAELYITDYLEYETFIKDGYFFMFIPKSI